MGKYRVLGAFLDRVFRNDLNANFDDIDTDIRTQKTRVDELIIGTPQPSEVVDARGGFPVLNDRLEDVSSKLAQMVNHKPILIFDGIPTIQQLPIGTIGIVLGINEFYDNFNSGILNTNKWKVTKGFATDGGIDALSGINVQNDKMSLSVKSTVSGKSAQVRAMILGAKLHWENQKKIISFKTIPYAVNSTVSLYIDNNEATDIGVLPYIIRLIISNSSIVLQVNGVGSTLVYNQSYAVTSSDNIEKTYTLELFGKNIRLLENGMEKLNTGTLPSIKTNSGYVYLSSETTSGASLYTRTVDDFGIS